MQKKRLITIFCVIVGGSSALAAGHWPQYGRTIQMALYTIMVFGIPFLHFWSQRNRGAFWGIMLSALIAHGMILYLIRSIFPFQSVLIVVPIALIEAIAIVMAMMKTFSDRDVEYSE